MITLNSIKSSLSHSVRKRCYSNYHNMKCGDLIYQKMVENNVKNSWIYSGGAIMPVIDAFYHKNNINYYIATHEQNAGHAATGYSKSSNETGVVIVTSGPGLTNLVTPILDATNDSTPLVVLSGQVPKRAMGSLAFQECPATQITESITKWSYCIDSIEEIPQVIDLAFKIANDGKKGAVHLDLPKCIASSIYQDHNKSFTHLDTIEKSKIKNVKEINYIDPLNLNDIAEAINSAERPILYVGQGCNNYSDILTAFIERTNIPITTTLHAMGVFDETHPLALKMVGMHGSVYSNLSIQEADCIIALGSRFDDRTTGEISKYAPKARKNNKIIHVNIDQPEIGKIIKSNYNVLADCGDFLHNIYPLIHYKPRKEWLHYIDTLKLNHPFKYYKAPDNKIKTQSVLTELNKQTIDKNNVIFSMGVGNHMMMSCQFIDWKRPKQVIASGSLGVMGCSTGYAIGAKIANPESIVVSIDGDGSFNMTSSELKTIMEYNIPVKIAILNDSSLQMVKIWEELFFEKRIVATDNNHNPDYIMLAKSYGLETLYCDNYTDLPHTMETFLNIDKPVLCEFKVEKDICLPLVGPGKALHEMILFEDYHKNCNLNLTGEAPN